MANPLATNLGTAILVKQLQQVQALLEDYNERPPLDLEATDLLEQVKDLLAVTVSLDIKATEERRNSSMHLKTLSATELVHMHSVCDSAASIIQECTDFAEPFQSSLRGIIQTAQKNKYVEKSSQLRNQAWYDETIETLTLRTDVLRVLLSAISLLSHKNETDEDGNLSPEAQSFASTLRYQVALVNPRLHGSNKHDTSSLRRAVAAATGVTLHVPASLNKHFVVGRSPKSFYTGRAQQMSKVKAALEVTKHTGQRRFVIYGLGGSGKTELALKYAEEHMQSYWGVFLVDGSSGKTASGSYAEIAQLGGVEPNERAAKNWLTTRAVPWLLIIDNADDDEVPLDELIPAGTKGCILITSRNPAHKSYGTVGQRYLELLPMEEGEANELILKAAEEPSPWAKSVKDSAQTICEALGFLPLALVHAGKAILLGLCSWHGQHGYLVFYERQAQRIRRDRLHRRERSLSRSRNRPKEDQDSMNVFSSYEILYQSLEASQEESFEDAVELLNVFSYLHFQNIRLDILISVATNPLREARAREEAIKEEKALRMGSANLKKVSWLQWLREMGIRLVGYFDTPAPLPTAMKNPDNLNESNLEAEVHVRLSQALQVLLSRSLIMKQDRLEDRYSMHPLVHKWVRERPEMSTSQQALWCQVATTTLARTILLPPLGDSENGRSIRREILPHIMHVRSCQEVVKERLKENQAIRRSPVPVVTMGFGKLQAEEAARFSRVYSESGLFNEALVLQSQVHAFVTGRLGEEHRLSVMITLALAGTLWELSRVSEATILQRRIQQVCVSSLGEDNPLSLKVTDLLGRSLCFQGRWAQSLALHKRAVEGMTKMYGPDHENTFKAMNGLALAHLRHMEFAKAAELHELAWHGLKKTLGDAHVDTLACLEDLVMSRLRLGEEALPGCHEMMTHVFEQRKKILGKEQPYTLLAICNLGRVKSAMGQHDEAARIMKDAYEIAERNLGENHYGVLAGKTHYAQVLVNQGQYEEAERMLYTVVDKPKYKRMTEEDGEHPDRMIAIWYLVGCLEKQGKFQLALDLCNGLVTSLEEIGGKRLGTKHPFATLVRKEIDTLEAKMQNTAEVGRANEDIPAEL